MQHQSPRSYMFVIAAALLFELSGCASSNIPPHQVTTLTSDNGTQLMRHQLPEGAAAFAVGEGFVWVLGISHNILKLDPQSLAVAGMIPLSKQTYWMTTMAVGEGAVWVPGKPAIFKAFGGSTLFRIDPNTNHVVAEIPLDGCTEGIAVGEGSVWIGTGKTVTRIDPKTNQVVARIPVGSRSWDRISVGAGSVWVLKILEGMVYRIDPVSNQVVAQISLNTTADAVPNPLIGGMELAARGTAGVMAGIGMVVGPLIEEGIEKAGDQVGLDLSMGVDKNVPSYNYDLASDRIAFPDLLASSNAIWVADASPDNSSIWSVLRIDPQTNGIVERIRFPGKPYSMTLHQEYLWVSVRTVRGSQIQESPCRLLKIDPTRNVVLTNQSIPPESDCPKYHVPIHFVRLANGHGALWGLKHNQVWRIVPPADSADNPNR